MIRCKICKKLFKRISWRHLKYKHGITIKEYKKKYNVKHLQSKSTRKLVSKKMEGNDNAKGHIFKPSKKWRKSKSRFMKGTDYGLGYIFTEEQRKNSSIAKQGNDYAKGHKCSKENKERQRRLMLKLRTDGKITSEMSGCGYCKKYKVKNHLGKTVKVQGKLERKFAELLTKVGIRWFIPKPKIYMLNGKEHYYFCDFWLPDERLYIEVKGFIRDDDYEKVCEKMKMMVERGKRRNHTIEMKFGKDIKDFELNVADVEETLVSLHRRRK